MEEIVGLIERITFQNEETGYAVIKIKIKSIKDLVTVIGTFPGIQIGETIRLFGVWKQHLIHGKQFSADRFSIEMPVEIEGIRKYLGSGLIKGIGPIYAERIVQAFGDETLVVIEKTPDKLLTIEGLGKKRLESIKESWQTQKSIRNLMIFLRTYDISPGSASRIFKLYGEQAVFKIKENPYLLAKEVHGIGFKTADTIASKMGYPHDSPLRVESGLQHILFTLSEEGHTCLPESELLEKAKEELALETDFLKKNLENLLKEGTLIHNNLVFEGSLLPFIWTRPLFLSEMGIAKELKRLTASESRLRKIDLKKALEWVQNKLSIKLAEKQELAVKEAVSKKALIITGGPGTGKSTITNAVISISEVLTNKIVLAAPTGRAAKRMSEITKKKASTIHSLLEYDFTKGGFKKNRENPIDCDLLIIDEASMIDTLLMYQLLRAVPDHARVIFVGDIHQLPSVGAGNVLKDLIASRQIAVKELKEIFRQAQGSKIITNAHRINLGQFPDLRNDPQSDFFFLEAKEPELVLKEVLSLAATRLPSKYGFDPKKDIQVIAPMRKGVIGIENLNRELQKELNPKEEGLSRFGQIFKENDKVMQIRNNYKKQVYNGDIGFIKFINYSEQELTVSFDSLDVCYEFSEMDELALAYAVSVHKYQGSEAPCIIFPIHTSHFKMLQRNLLYTAVTRGKKMVVLVGNKKALAIAAKNDEVKRRYTGLKQALMNI